MLENNKVQLEEAKEDEVDEGKVIFPKAGLIIIGVILLLMIACIVVIAVLEN